MDERLSIQEIRIVAFLLLEGRWCSTETIAKGIQLHVKDVYRHRRKLIKLGLLEERRSAGHILVRANFRITHRYLRLMVESKPKPRGNAKVIDSTQEV